MARSVLYKSMSLYVYTRSRTFPSSRWLMYCCYTQEAVPACQLASAHTYCCMSCSYIQGATPTYQLVRKQGVSNRLALSLRLCLLALYCFIGALLLIRAYCQPAKTVGRPAEPLLHASHSRILQPFSATVLSGRMQHAAQLRYACASLMTMYWSKSNSWLGLSKLCWHNFENNRSYLAMGIMPA